MRDVIAKTFRAEGAGLGKVLGHLEEDVMNALWKKDELCGKDIFVEIKGHRDIAYTTVLTVLERLVKKGLVKKRRANAGYLFATAYSKDEFSSAVSREVLLGVMELSCSNTLASLVDMLAKKDPRELERLSGLIESKKKEFQKKHD
ncbi:MAG: BlaI/MecI/CopY family transcriptional regulator [Deltaproteobacteria bacterium]|nr:BlaI/MecI/CopY family transcriptional regulator [Deltaproteobacteria bacterium]